MQRIILSFAAVALIAVSAHAEKAPTWLSGLADPEKTEVEFLDALSKSADFHKLLDEAKKADSPGKAAMKALGTPQGQEFTPIINNQPPKDGILTTTLKNSKDGKTAAETLAKDKVFAKLAQDAFKDAKTAINARPKGVAGPGFAHLCVEALNSKIAESEGMVAK